MIQRIHRERFGNAADFTFFIAGAFTEADVVPMLERWLASLPSTGPRRSEFRDMQLQFPAAVQRAEVVKGKEPASQSVLSFFADTRLDELEMHRARAASTLVSMRLRDILREQLGGTYGVSVNYGNTIPQSGYGTVTVAFGSAPDRVDGLQKAVVAEVTRLRADGPSADDVQKVQEMERRELETSTAPEPLLDRLAADRPHAEVGRRLDRPPRRTHRVAVGAGAARRDQEVPAARPVCGGDAETRIAASG